MKKNILLNNHHAVIIGFLKTSGNVPSKNLSDCIWKMTKNDNGIEFYVTVNALFEHNVLVG
jgi:hypothetical protein